MHPLFSMIVETLETSDYDFDVSEAHQTIRIRVEGDTIHWTTYLRVLPREQIVIYSKPDIQVPEPKRLIMAEFLTRANFGIVVGNFEMDFEDGEVRFKTSIDSSGEVFSSTILVNLLNGNLANTNCYLPGVMGVAFGDLSAIAALNACEPIAEDAP
jgi:hypothetical protein